MEAESVKEKVEVTINMEAIESARELLIDLQFKMAMVELLEQTLERGWMRVH